MSTRRKLLLVGCILSANAVGLVAGAQLARAEEGDEKDIAVALKDIPAAVVGIGARFADGLPLERATLADEDGVRVYELHYRSGHRDRLVQTTTTGELFAVEESVPSGDVPELVRTRASRLFPSAVPRYERTTVEMFEVSAPDGHGGETELLVNRAGAAFREVAPGVLEEQAKKR